MLKYILLLIGLSQAQITITFRGDTLTALPLLQTVKLQYKTDFDPQTDYITVLIENITTKVATPTKVLSQNSFETLILIPDTKQDHLEITIKEYRKDGGYSHLPVSHSYPVYYLDPKPTSIVHIKKTVSNTTTFFDVQGRPYGTKYLRRWVPILVK